MSNNRYGTLIEDIQNAIWTWLHEAMNTKADFTVLPEGDPDAVPVLRAQEGAPRPQKTFCEFDFLTNFQKLGLADELLYDADLDSFKLRGPRDFSITVNFVGSGAYQLSALAQQALDSPAVVDKLREAGLAYRGSDLISDRTLFLETAFEERAVLDSRFGIALELKDAVSRIEQVEINSGLPGGTTTVVDLTP